MPFRAWLADRLRTPVPAACAPPDHYDPTDVAAMLREIGVALIEVFRPIQVVEERLLEIAARYTTQPVRVSALPTMLFIQIGTDTHEMDASVQPSSRFDVAARVDEVVDLAAAGAIAPDDAVAAVNAARRQPPRFGALATIGGYALTTVGFGMLSNPSWKALLAHLFLGLVVGVIVEISGLVPNLAPIVPTLSALVVTLLATWFVADVAGDGLLRVITPALIATLPGMPLMVGAIELAAGKVISGASRTVYGLAQMGLLAYGVRLGVQIAGQVPPQRPSTPMGPWSLYAAIVVIAVGLYFYLSAPRGSLVWLLATVAVATLAQTLAGHVLGPGYSGFVAAIVAIPFAMLASRLRGAPPVGVLILVMFWSLIPGQLTFMSLSRKLSGDVLNTATLSVAASAIISIALGALVSWSLLRGVTGQRQLD
jgi:uncharacterized membrane protein YjjP (DUF1212 family)